MYKPLPLALAALACATSCVPEQTRRVQVSALVPPRVTSGKALLRRMALDVPDDLAGRVIDLTLPDTVAPGIAPPFATGAQTSDDAARATECLTAAVYYEARSESPDGQQAVAQVVLNRVRDRAYPASVCGVVYQGSTRRTGCQFSFTCDGSMDRPRDGAAWARARGVATAALAGAVYAPVGSATSYHADSVLPWWASSLTRITSVGAHIFYRWRSGLERALAFRQTYSGHEPVPALTLAASGEGAGEADEVGVTVHRGGDLTGLVTIHRGTAPAHAGPAPLRTVSTAGVRVHLNAAVDRMAPVDAEAVSEELDPT